MMSAQSVLNEENSLFSLLIDGEPICIGAVHVRAEDLAILRSIFSMVDLDGGATISGYELHWMMKVLKKDAYSEEECRSVMGTSNPYVALNFEEFVRILTTVNWGFPLTEVHQRLAKAFEVRHKFSKRLEALSPPQSSAGSSYPTEWNTAASPVYEVVVRRLVKRESTERQYLIDEEIHNRTAVMHQLESSYQVMSVRTKLELELRRERIKSRLSQIRKHNNHPSESKVPLPFGSQENREDFERAMKCEADQRNRLSILQKTNETNVQLVAVLDELRKASLGKVRAWIGADTEAVIQASHRRAVVVDRQLDELEHCIVAIGRQLFQSSIMDSTTDHRGVMREFYRNLELSYMATAAENEWTPIEENLMSTETSRGGFDVDCVSLPSSDSDQHPSFRKNIVKKKSCLKEIREKSDFTWLLLPHETVHAVSHRSTHTKASAKVSMLSNTASDSNSIIGSVTALEEEEYLLCHSDPSSFQILGDEELNEEFHTIMKEMDDVIHMLYRYAASDPSKGLTYADYRNFVRVCRIKLPVSVECLTSVWNHIFRPDPTYGDYLKLQISKHLSYATVVHPSFDEETHIASSAPRTGSVRPYQLGSTHQTPCRALSFDGREFTGASKTKELCDSHNVFPQYMHFEHFRGALLIHACERYIRCPGVNPAWKLRVYVYQYIRVQLPKLESAFLHILTRRSAQTSAKPYVAHGAEKLWSEFHNRNLKEGTGDVVKTDGDEAIVSSSTLHHPVTTTKVLRNTSSECKLISSSENALCRPPLGSRPPRCSIYGVLNNTYDVLVSNAKSLARLFVEQMHQNSLKPRIDPVVKLQNQNFVMNELDRPTYDLHVLALRTALNSQLLATALGYNDITDMHGEESVPPLNLPIRPHSVDMSQRDSISQPSLNMHEGTVSTSAARSCGMETIGQRARSDLRVRENRNDSSDVDPEGKAHTFTHGYMPYVSPNLPCSPSSSSATPVLPPAMSKCITKAPLHVCMRQLLACIPVRALRRECSLGAFVEVCRYRHPELDRKWLTLCAVSVITHVIQENFTLLTGTHQIRHSDVDEERQRQILTYLISNTTDLDCSVEDLVTTCRTETTTLVLKDLDQLPLPFIMVLMILIHIGNLYGTSTFAASIQCLTTLHRRHYTATSVDSINETHKGENNGLDLNEDVLSPEYTTRLADFFQALLMETKEFQFWHI